MVRSVISRYPALFGYGLVAITWVLAFIAWAEHTPRAFRDPSAYDIFPLLGLLAFGGLWSIYVFNAVTTWLRLASEKLRSFYQNMGYAVLVLILSHPSALLTRLYMDGYGLPPMSYGAYVNKPYIWVVYLGMISLFIFLSFELHRWFARKGWWKWVVYANDVAMFLILYHGMTLGSELQKGWFRYVWWLYGLVLIIAIVYLRFIVKRVDRPNVNEQ